MKCLLYLWLSLSFGLAASGCATYQTDMDASDGADDSDGAGDSDGDWSKPKCQNHDDCDEHERCIEGQCLSEPPPCGEDPPPCGWNEETQVCEGGWYVCSHFCPDDPDCCWCECPAGDSGCPCWTGGHCQGCCMGDENDCENTKIGTCYDRRVYMPLGCNCLYFEGGFTWICAD